MLTRCLPVIRSHFPQLKVPTAHDKVYNDECVYSFDSPFSDTGLYVNVLTWQGVGQTYLRADAAKTGCKVYLHQQWVQVPVPVPKETEGEKADPQKLAIGVAGGFSVGSPQYEVVKEATLVVFLEGDEQVTLPFPNPELPEFFANVVTAILEHGGMRTQMSVQSWDADNEKVVSKYAESLVQLVNGKKISNDPSTWRCEKSGDTHNLWLNLSTGYIGGGRRNWDGSGGSGAALSHYEDTGGLYPLCVKLGTITPHGADVWSYSPEEDCLVIDPLLPQHLAHWGIDLMKLEKTDKSLGELEVELNSKYDWSKILEGGEELTVMSGPGCVGLRNIGSSCYMNSVLQPLLTIPEIADRYLGRREAILRSAPGNPADDFAVQFSKVAHGLLTDTYCPPPLSASDGQQTVSMTDGEAAADTGTLEKHVVAPRMLKHLVGRGHPEFSSGRQQDASEYFMHLLDIMGRAERTALPRVGLADAKPTPSLFEFQIETRVQCLATQEVRYSKTGRQSMSNVWELRIPLDRAVNREEVAEHEQLQKRCKLEEPDADGAGASAATTTSSDVPPVKPLVPFEACRDRFFDDEVIEFTNPSVGHVGHAVRQSRFKTFPRYLMVKLWRYYVDNSWKQVKVDALVPMPEELDLTAFRGTGLQADETPMPESTSAAAVTTSTTVEVTADESIVAQLVSMGFSDNGSRRAALATHNSSADAAMAWVFEHMEDADFNDPPATTTAAISTAVAKTSEVSEESIMMLSSMGYTTEQVTAALLATDHNIERAADWLCSHLDDLDTAVATVLSSAPTAGGNSSSSSSSGGADPSLDGIDDGEGKYSMVAVISHIGKNTDHGHYVCHIKKGGVWVLFNDEKVAQSKVPPIEHGFMFLYRRNDADATPF